MDKDLVVEKTADFVRSRLNGDSTGHDWWHIYRVWKMSLKIARNEGQVDLFTVQLAALLHDIADWKFNNGDDKICGKEARKWLETLDVDSATISKVCYIIKNISFKGAKVKSKMESKEGKIVQDADRLDAIGAIGIGRTFAYGGAKKREMYDPDVKPRLHSTFKAYKNSDSNTINHFYEKLLLLENKMNTKTGKIVAAKRTAVMKRYLNEFFAEWDGKR